MPPKEGPPPPYSCHEPPNEPESEALLHQPTMSQSKLHLFFFDRIKHRLNINVISNYSRTPVVRVAKSGGKTLPELFMSRLN